MAPKTHFQQLGQLGLVLGIYVPVDVNSVELESAQKVDGTSGEVLHRFVVFDDI